MGYNSLPMDAEVRGLIEQLQLRPHPEGGYYRESYRSTEQATALPKRFDGPRSLSTAILFLLPHGHISTLHRIKSDELWHFYQGAPLRVVSITPEGTRHDVVLGSCFDGGHRCQAVVPEGRWFGAHVESNNGWSLVGCTVAPGFEFTDFEMAERGELIGRYPQHTSIITSLTTGGMH